MVVTVRKQITRPAVVDFMVRADRTLQPTQKELITLGLLAQHEALTAIELVKVLELSRADDLKHWIGRLKDWGVVNSRGKTKATEYFVEPEVLRTLEFQGETTLRGIERHRLRELILRDLEIYRKAGISEIHERIGKEIPRRKLRQNCANWWPRMRLARTATRGPQFTFGQNDLESTQFCQKQRASKPGKTPRTLAF